MIFATLTILSPLASEDVERRIDERGREWRESSIPPQLRRLGVFGIRTRRNGHSFELQTQGRGKYFGRPVLRCRLVGQLLPLADGTTEVRARHRAARKFYVTVPVWIAWNVYIAWNGGVFEWFLAAVLALLPFTVGDALAEDERKGLLQVVREVAGVDANTPFEVTRVSNYGARAV